MKRISSLLGWLLWPYETAVREQAAKAAQWFLEDACACTKLTFASRDGQLLVHIEGCLKRRFAEMTPEDCSRYLREYIEDICQWERYAPIVVIRRPYSSAPQVQVRVTAASVLPRRNKWVFVGSDLHGELP